MRFSVLVPTRKRHNRLREFLGSINATAHNPSEIEILFYVDEDDDITKEHKLIKENPNLNIQFFRKPREEIQGNRYNFLLGQSQGDFIMYAADDLIFESPYWDKYVYSEFTHYQDRIVLIYPRTKNYNCRLAAHGFVSRESTRVLGRLFTPYFRSVCDDVWLTEVYKMLGRLRCFDKIHITHKHFSYSPGVEVDDTYKEGKTAANADTPAFAAHKDEILNDVRLLNYYIGSKAQR